MTLTDIVSINGRTPVPRIALTLNAAALIGVIITGSVTYGRQAHELESLTDNARSIRAGIDEMRNIIMQQKIENSKIDARVDSISREVSRMQSLMDGERVRSERSRP